jgi:hypothetical protein
MVNVKVRSALTMVNVKVRLALGTMVNVKVLPAETNAIKGTVVLGLILSTRRLALPLRGV